MSKYLKIIIWYIGLISVFMTTWKCSCYADYIHNVDEEVDGNDDVGRDYETHTEFNEFTPLTVMGVEAPCIFDLFDGGRVCNCGFRDEEMFLPRMDGNIFQIRVINCKKLRINTGTFISLSMMRAISFNNVEDLMLETRSLAFRVPSNKIRMEFTNVVIEDIPSHTISGSIDVLTFDRCKIGVFRAFSINGLANEMFSMDIRNSTINRLEPQAFKKFSIGQLTLANNQFVSSLPSRAFYEIEVSNVFTLRNCNFTGIFPGALGFTGVGSFQMINNQIDILNGDSIHMRIKEAISIRDNRITTLYSGGFRSIILDPDYFSRHSEPPDFEFTNNTIDIPDQPQRLLFATNFNIKISRLLFIRPIGCPSINTLRSNIFFDQYGDSIYFRTENIANIDTNERRTFSQLLNEKCVQESYLMYVIIGVVVVLVILIVVLFVVVLLYLRRRRAAQQMNVIQPEGKTYRETQIVLQIENAGLLKTDL